MTGRPLAVVTTPGLEALTQAECAALGLSVTARDAGVLEGTASLADVMRANLWLRTASRVLVGVAEFRAASFAELERRAARLPWETWLTPAATVRFRVTCRKSKLYHSGAVAQRLGEALQARCPAVRVASGSGAADHEGDDDAGVGDDAQLLVVRLFRDHLTLRLDSSGALLHRRGWRQAVGKAPMRETLAAALLQASGWDDRSPLCDPLCGSGTIAIEAALRARGMAPGRDRAFAFERWPDTDPDVWRALRDEARARELPASPARILASDRDEGAIDAARQNAGRAGVADDIAFAHQPLSAATLPAGPGWIVTNPPYGVRVGEREPLRDLYARLGQLARRAGAGWTLALIGADPRLEAQLRLPLEERARTRTGGLPIRLLAAAATD